MRKYEGIFIIKPDLNEENLNGIMGLIEGEIKKKGGQVDEVKSWGKRRFAYSIKRFEEGLYYQIDFGIEPAALEDMGRKFRLNDNILRFMIIKKEKK